MHGTIRQRGVQIYPYTRDGGVWIYLRSGKHSIGSWEVPTGKCDLEESFIDAARRELLEEVGLSFPAGRFTYQCTITTPSVDEPNVTWTMAAYIVVLTPEETPVLNEPHNHDFLQKFDNAEVVLLPKTMVFAMSESIRKIWMNQNDYI